MNKLYSLQVDILNMILRFMLGFSIMGACLLQYAKHTSDIYGIFGLVPASVISLLIGKFTKHIWSYCVMQLVLLIGYIFLVQEPIVRLIFCAFIILNAFFQFMTALGKSSSNIPWFLVFVIVGMYLLCKYQFSSDIGLNHFYLIFALFYLLIYILNMYYVNFNNYFAKHVGVYKMPINQIKISNNFFIAVIVSVCFCVMLLFTQLPVDKLFHNTSQPNTTITEPGKQQNNMDSMDTVPNTDLEGLIQESHPASQMLDVKANKFWYYATRIMLALLITVASVIIIKSIIYLCIRFYKQFYRKKASNAENQIEFIPPMKEKKKAETRNKKVSVNIFRSLFVKSNNDRIRKYYYKAVAEHASKETTLEYLTPTQLSTYALASADKQAKRGYMTKNGAKVTDLYEKARYSDKECTSMEVQELRSLIKEAHTVSKK